MFTILQGYYNWIDQLWEGNMLQSPYQEALTDPIVPILGVLLFLHNEDLCPSSERIYLSEGSSITRKHSFLAPLRPQHLDTRLHNSNYPVERNTLSFHHPLLNILTPDDPISTPETPWICTVINHGEKNREQEALCSLHVHTPVMATLFASRPKVSLKIPYASWDLTSWNPVIPCCSAIKDELDPDSWSLMSTTRWSPNGQLVQVGNSEF